jgi:hypothetical protein
LLRRCVTAPVHGRAEDVPDMLASTPDDLIRVLDSKATKADFDSPRRARLA